MIRNEGGYVKDVATHCLVRFERTRDQCLAYIHFWLHQRVKIGTMQFNMITPFVH